VPAGTSMVICGAQAVPTGWIVTGRTDCSSCCGSIGFNITIKKYDGLPVGTTLQVCKQAIPGGWVKLSEQNCSCCGSVNVTMRIKRLN